MAPRCEILKQNYAGVPGVVFENVALADQEGSRTFYRLRDDPTLPVIAGTL